METTIGVRSYYKSPLIVAAAFLAIGVVLAAWIASYYFFKVHTLGNTISVTGSATEDVKADSAKWTVSVAHTAYEAGIPAAEAQVVADMKAVSAFFASNGIASTSVQTSPIYVDQNYSSNGDPISYNVHEDITVQSTDPDLINTLSKNISALSSRGILVSVQQPEYYVSSLAQIRVALIGAAVTDAKARALQVASSTGQSVGALESASSGVVQVLAPNSDDVSDGGSYDTSTIQKEVMVTAHATFYLR